MLCFFCKQKTAYEIRISDWSSDVCSSDLIAAADALQPVIEIEHDLVERQHIGDLRAAADISEVLLHPAAVLAQLQDRAEIVVGHVNHRLDPRLLDLVDAVGVGHVGGVVELDLLRRLIFRVAEIELVDHRRRGGDEVRSEERSAGKECVSQCISRGAPYPIKK